MKPHLHLRIVVALSLIALSAPTETSARELHTWTDSTGQHKIDAEFIAVDGKNVRLRRRDGQSVSLPIAKLSKADQKYLKELVKSRKQAEERAADAQANGGANEQPVDGASDPSAPDSFAGPSADEVFDQIDRGFAKAEEMEKKFRAMAKDDRARFRGGPGDDPLKFKVGDKVEVKEYRIWEAGTVTAIDDEMGRYEVKLTGRDHTVEVPDFSREIRAYDGASGAPGDDAAIKATTMDFNRIRQIAAIGGAGGGFQPDPAPVGSRDWPAHRVDLTPTAGSYDELTALAVAGPSKRAVVIHKTFGKRDEDLFTVDVCDLSAGRVVANLRAPQAVAMAALSPSGDRLITVSQVEALQHGPVLLWQLGDKELKLLGRWNAVVDADGGELTWIGWADDEHVVTVDDSGLVMWSVDGPRGEYRIPSQDMRAPPAFSPGGRQFAIGMGAGVSIHDVATGKLLVSVPMSDLAIERRVAFSPSGAQLAVASDGMASAYDLATGKKKFAAEFTGVAGPGGDSFCWLNEEYILADGTAVIHVPSQMTLWRYVHNASGVEPLGGRMWYAFRGRGKSPAALVPFELPHAAVTPVTDSELALRPGDEVSIQMELTAAPTLGMGGKMTPPEEQLKQALRQAGYVVAGKSNKQIIARATSGQPHEINYRMFTGQTGTMTVTPRVYGLELIVDGQSVWKQQNIRDAPTMVLVEENETIEQATERALQTDTGFFHSAIPSRVVTADVRKARTSKLTSEGIE